MTPQKCGKSENFKKKCGNKIKKVSETDVAPKVLSGRMDGMGLEISGQGYANSAFTANKSMTTFENVNMMIGGHCNTLISTCGLLVTLLD